MINFNSLPHSITAAIGAVLMSTMFIGAAVGPEALTGRSVAQAQISAQASA